MAPGTGGFWRCYGHGPIRSTCFVGIADHWACTLLAPIFFLQVGRTWPKQKWTYILQGLHVFIYSYPQLPLHFCVNAHTFLEALPYDICSISYPPVIKHGKGKSSINGKFTIDVGFSIVIFDFQRVTSRLFRQLLRRKTWNSSVLHVSWLFWLRWKLDLRE